MINCVCYETIKNIHSILIMYSHLFSHFPLILSRNRVSLSALLWNDELLMKDELMFDVKRMKASNGHHLLKL